MKKIIFGIFCSAVLSILSIDSVSAQLVFDKAPEFIYHFKSATAGNQDAGYWDQAGPANKTKLGNNFICWSRDDGPDQLFKFKPAGGGWYNIEVLVSGGGNAFVDLAGGANGVGVNVITGPMKNTNSQKFRLVHRGNGRYKIYTYWGRIVSTDGTQGKNNTKIVTFDDQFGPWTEWYFEANSTKTNYVPSAVTADAPPPSGNIGSDLMLKDVMGNENGYDSYFPRVTNNDFTAQNSGDVLQNYLGSLPAAEQWKKLLLIIQSARKNNDIGTRNSILKAVANAAIKPGSGFVEKAMRGPMRQSFQKEREAEKDSSARIYIWAVEEKFE